MNDDAASKMTRRATPPPVRPDEKTPVGSRWRIVRLGTTDPVEVSIVEAVDRVPGRRILVKIRRGSLSVLGFPATPGDTLAACPGLYHWTPIDAPPTRSPEIDLPEEPPRRFPEPDELKDRPDFPKPPGATTYTLGQLPAGTAVLIPQTGRIVLVQRVVRGMLQHVQSVFRDSAASVAREVAKPDGWVAKRTGPNQYVRVVETEGV